jgi:hypothetical protein
MERNLLDVGLDRPLQADDDLESSELLMVRRDRLRPVVAEVDSQILQQGNRLGIADTGGPAATVIFANFRKILARNRLGDRAEQGVVLVEEEDAKELRPPALTGDREDRVFTDVLRLVRKPFRAS